MAEVEQKAVGMDRRLKFGVWSDLFGTNPWSFEWSALRFNA